MSLERNIGYINPPHAHGSFPMSDMACPFIEEVVDEGAAIVRRAFRAQRTFRDRHDPFAFSDPFLYERYRFSRDGLIYLCSPIGKQLTRKSSRNNALTASQTLCIGLRFFASGTFLYTVGDAEHVSKVYTHGV